jgi:tetratricopeptide (TPR) repeat protein
MVPLARCCGALATRPHRGGTRAAGILCILLLLAPLDDVRAGHRFECPSSDVDLALWSCSLIIGHPGAAPADWATAFMGRCIALWQKGAHQKAGTDCAEAVRLGANSALAHLIRGLALEDGGDHQGAIAAFTRALELEPTPAAHYDRAAAWLALGDYRRAIEDLDQAIAGGERAPQVFINRAVARLALGDPSAALGDVERGSELLQDDATARAIRLRVLTALGREAAERARVTGLPGVAAPGTALAFYPASKVLPDTLLAHSQEPTIPRPGVPVAAAEMAAPKPEIAPRPAFAPAPRPRRVTIRPLAERIADCLSLWSAETLIPKQRWKETCTRFETSLERPAGPRSQLTGR